MSDLASLEAFVRVAETRSFSGAARVLDLTPSAVSKQVGRLEDRLGVRLFNRTTRRVRLTDLGQAFYERAARILGDLAEAERAVIELHGTPSGKLAVSLPLAFGRRHVMPHLPAFLDAHPQVRLDLSFSDRFVDLVEDGIDVALRIGELADSSLIARRLAPNRRVVCAAPAYVARHAPPRRPADLVDHNCLVYTYRAMRNEWRFHGPDGAAESVRVTGNLETNDPEALYMALCDGVGAALLPLWLVGVDLKAGTLVRLMPGYHAPDSAIHALYPPGRHLSPKVRAFVDFLAARIGGRESWSDDEPATPGAAR